MAASRRDSVSTTTSAASITPNLPSSADGDVLLLMVSGYATLGTPSGGNQTWTQITTETRGGPFGANIAMATYWAVRGATAPTAPTISNGATDQINAVVMSIQDADTTTPIDAALDANGQWQGVGQVQAPSVSPAGTDSLLVVFYHGAGSTGPGTWSQPTGMTEHHDFGAFDYDSCHTQALSASGATGVRESTPSIQVHWIASTIAVKSAAGGASHTRTVQRLVSTHTG